MPVRDAAVPETVVLTRFTHAARLRRRLVRLLDQLSLQVQIGIYTAMLCLLLLGVTAATAGWLAGRLAEHHAQAALRQAAAMAADRAGHADQTQSELVEARVLLIAAGLPDSICLLGIAPGNRAMVIAGSGSAAESQAAQSLQRSGADLLQAASGRSGAWLTGYAIARDDLIIVAGMPRAVALQPARDLVGALLLVGGCAMLLAILAAMIVGQRLASPIRQLCDQAETIGGNADSGKLRWARGSSEVLRLSRSMRSLVRRLGAAERRLANAAQAADANSARFARQIETLRRLADTDPLTGLLNRRGFLGAAHTVRRGPENEPVGVLILDIDRFKQVNDRYGHATGDEVIRAVAAAIQGVVRQGDCVARLGGEEFVVAAAGPPDALKTLAERLRVATQQVVAAPNGIVRVTVSIGGAVALPGDRDLQDAIDRADTALYQAKQAGRNCVRIQQERAGQRTG